MGERKEELRQENIEQVQETKPARRKMPRWMYFTLLAIFGSAFLLGAVYVGGYLWQTGSAEQEYEDLADIYLQENSRPTGTTQSTDPTPPPTEGTTPTAPAEPTMLPNMQKLYELNNDTVGYIHFPTDAVKISYPVMQSPYDEDFYLTHKFDRSPNVEVAIGCPYVPLSCNVNTPTDNVIIYGHYLRTGGMFGPLGQYVDKEFWEKNQTFYFDTLYERHTYQIFAVFKTAARQRLKDGTPYGYPYHKQINFETEEAFDKFISDIKGAAFDTGGYVGWSCFKTDITPQYGDKLVCLSTCEYSIKDPYTNEWDGRLVIMAYRID